MSPGPAGDSGLFRQQIGEIVATVKIHTDQLNRLEGRFADELRGIRGDARQLDQLVTGRLEVMADRIGKLEDSVARSRDEIAKMQEPLEKLVAQRNQLIAYFTAGAAIITILWFVVGPLVRAFLESTAKRLTGG